MSSSLFLYMTLTEEQRKVMSEKAKASWKDPEIRRKRIENARITRQRNKEKDPEKYRRGIKPAREALKDPEVERRRREKISQTMKNKIANNSEWKTRLQTQGNQHGFKKGHKGFRTQESYNKQFTPEVRKAQANKMREMSSGRTGESHPNWKGGITAFWQQLRHSPEYIAWRDAVYKRDNYTCQVCDTHCRKGNIVAHHIKDFKEFIEERFDVENGITMCRKCHMKHHGIKPDYDRRRRKKNQAKLDLFV
jgi:hypothetical protein